MHTLLGLVASLAMLSSTAVAQELPKPGTIVRLETWDNQLIAGDVLQRRGDSLWVRDTSGSALRVIRPDIRDFSTYGTQWGKGAKRGAIVGGIIGAVGLGAAIWADTHGKGECICIPLSYVVAPVAVGLPIVGAGVGLLFAPSGWSKQRGY